MIVSAERLPEALPAIGQPVHRNAPAVLEVRDLRTSYARPGGSWAPAVDGISFDLHAGEIMVLLGSGGSGKSTLLRSLAGLAWPDSGSVKVDGRTVFSSGASVCVPPDWRGLAMIRYSSALHPHMTVFDNVSCPRRGTGSRDRPHGRPHAAEVWRMLAAMGLERLAKHYPGQLGAAQRQRVALCRALAGNARVVLFDEPPDSMDPWTRRQLRIELLLAQRELGFAAVFATRDPKEALALAHTVAVLDRGRIAQHAASRRVYETPATVEVAALVGLTNQIGGVVIEAAGRDVVVNTVLGPITARRPAACVADLDGQAPLVEGDAATLMWRPGAARLCADGAGIPPVPDRWTGTVERSWHTGTGAESAVRVGDERFRVHAGGSPPAPGTRGRLELDPARVLAYPDNTSCV